MSNIKVFELKSSHNTPGTLDKVPSTANRSREHAHCSATPFLLLTLIALNKLNDYVVWHYVVYDIMQITEVQVSVALFKREPFSLELFISLNFVNILQFKLENQQISKD